MTPEEQAKARLAAKYAAKNTAANSVGSQALQVAQAQTMQEQQPQVIVVQAAQPQVAPMQPTMGIECPKCHSHNCQITMVEVGQKTKRKGIGFGGHLNNFFRFWGILFTFGILKLFWKKSEGVNSTKTVTRKTAICQSCGYSWTVR